MGARLVSVANDDVAHAAQAAYRPRPAADVQDAESRSGDGQGLGEPVQRGPEVGGRQVAEAEPEDAILLPEPGTAGELQVEARE